MLTLYIQNALYFAGRRDSILKSIGVRRVKHLSPESKVLYRKLHYYKRLVYNHQRKTLKTRQKQTRKEVLRKTLSSMDRIRARFFKSQVENQSRRPHGHRFTLDDKILAVALQKHCGSGYKLMSSIFDLPSTRTLHRLLNKINLKPGLNSTCFELFRTSNLSNLLDKYCLLMFDEMSIMPHLQYNVQKDVVEGFEDFGYRTTNKIANHVQV